jgi:hypothetical protein
VRDPKYATTAAAMLYPRPGGDPRARPKSPVVGANSPQQYQASATPGVRPRNRDGSEAPPPEESAAPNMPTGGPAEGGGGGYSPPPEPAPAPSGGGDAGPGRLNVKGKRPWER